jgi:trimeric autotransporter adhesin
MLRAKIEAPAGSRVLVLGFMMAALMAASLLVSSKPAHADTFTVANTNNSGTGSLRQAIFEANTNRGKDTIKFAIPGIGVKTISPTFSLPNISDPVVIDGYTQPGARPNSQEVGTDAILRIELDGTQMEPGVQVAGLRINASNVVVWGLAINRFPAEGIEINTFSSGVTGTRIEGNFIGTDPGGTLDRGNAFSGVSVRNGSKSAIVGGASPDKRNLISGNDGGGVALGNRGSNKVMGNLIGTSKDGSSPLGNDRAGVSAGGSSNNVIGGADAAAANTIAFNGKQGVLIGDDETTGNRILGNSVFSNGFLGIDLGNDFRTDNDPKDPDAGANTLQNFPVLPSAVTSAEGTTTIKGTLDSTPSTSKKRKTFTIQLISNPQNEGEGKTFLGQTTARTDTQGQASFTFETTKPLDGGGRITATATNSKGNTSEFSDPVPVRSAL